MKLSPALKSARAFVRSVDQELKTFQAQDNTPSDENSIKDRVSTRDDQWIRRGDFDEQGRVVQYNGHTTEIYDDPIEKSNHQQETTVKRDRLGNSLYERCVLTPSDNQVTFKREVKNAVVSPEGKVLSYSEWDEGTFILVE